MTLLSVLSIKECYICGKMIFRGKIFGGNDKFSLAIRFVNARFEFRLNRKNWVICQLVIRCFDPIGESQIVVSIRLSANFQSNMSVQFAEFNN